MTTEPATTGATPITFQEITTRSGARWTGEGGQEMFDVVVDNVPGVVIPTRMHEPGWYVRARNGPTSAYWNLRSEADVELLRRLCAAGKVLVEDGHG